MTDTIIGSYHILDDGEYVGDLNVRREGILTIFDAICKTERQGPFRLAVRSDTTNVTLGVMLPQDGSYHFTKSYSKNALNQLGIRSIDSCEILQPSSGGQPSAYPAATPDTDSPHIDGWQENFEPWLLFRDPDLSDMCRDLRGSLSRTEPNGDISFAVPVDRDKPFPALPIFCFGKWLKINGNGFVVFSIRDGQLHA